MSDSNLDPSIISVTNRAISVASTANPRELLKISRIGPSLEQTENANLEITLNARAEDLAPTATANELKNLGGAIGNLLEPQSNNIFMDWREGFLPDQRFANGQFLRTAGSHQKSWGGVTTTTLDELELTSVATGESLVYNSTSEKFENSTNTFAITVYAAEADLPATPLTGSLAYVTATSEVYYFDGNLWTIVQDVFSGIYRGNWQSGPQQNFNSNNWDPFNTSGTVLMVDGTEATGGTTVGGDVDTTSRWASSVYNNFNSSSWDPFNTSGTVLMVDGTESTGGTTVGGSLDTTSRWASSVQNNFNSNNWDPFNTSGTVLMVDGTEATGGTTVGGSLDTTSRWASSVQNNFNSSSWDPFNTTGTVIMVDGTEATDGTGGAVASLRLMASATEDDDGGDGSGSVYLFNTDGTGELKITASDAAASDMFGGSVATGHDKIAIGATGQTNSSGVEGGAVYVYNTDGTGELKITASDAENDDQFGYHGGLAIGENKIVVGASSVDDDADAYWTDENGDAVHYWNNGAIYVYDLDGSNEVKITTSDATYNDRFGTRVAVGGSKVVGSAPNDDNKGAIYIFDLNGSNEVKVTSTNMQNHAGFGRGLTIGDNKIAVGAPYENHGDVSGYQQHGAVFLYDMNGSNEIKIMPSDRDEYHRFGSDVAIGNGKLVVGARGPTSDSDVANSTIPNGAVYVYDLDGTNEVKITASDGNAKDEFGSSVAVMDGKILVGAKMQYSGGNGAIYMYDLDGTNEVKITPSDSAEGDRFGFAVAIVQGSVAGNVVGGSLDTTSRWASNIQQNFNSSSWDPFNTTGTVQVQP